MVSNYVPLSTLSYAAMTSISAGGRAYLPVDTILIFNMFPEYRVLRIKTASVSEN